MGIQEILQSEQENSEIILYKEGIFLRAYERLLVVELCLFIRRYI